MTGNSFVEAVRVICDVLIPGDGIWPSASAALGDVLVAFSPDTQAWLATHSPALFDAPSDERVNLMRSLEHAEPAMFEKLLSQVYDAYYNSPAAHAQVIRLAEAGPREPSPYFDPALIETVVVTRAGQRRL